MAFEIVGFRGATRNEGASVENIFGRTFETRQEAEQFILKEGRHGGSRYEDRFASSFGRRFGYGNAEIRESGSITQKTYTTSPLSASKEADRRESRDRLERRQAGISREEEKLLVNLDKAERKGDISKQSANELRSNIVNRDELAAYATARRTENTRNEIATGLFTRQADLANQRIQSSPIGTSAGQMLKMLPDQFRTPESTRSIGEFNYNRQLSTAPLTTLGRPSAIGSDELMPSVAARQGVDLVRDNQKNPLKTFGLYGVKPLYSQKGFSGGDDSRSTGRDYRVFDTSSDSGLGLSKTQGFETRIKNIRELEGKQQKFYNTFIEPPLNFLDKGSKFLIRGDGPIASRVRGAIRVVPKTPFYLIGFVSYTPVAIAKTLAIGEGLLREETRSSVFPEIKYSGTQAYTLTKEQLKSRELQGEILSPFPKLIFGLTKSSRASKALEIVETSKAKGTFPEMRVLQSPSIKRVAVERKTTDILRDLGTGSEVVKPSNLATSRYSYDIIKQGVSTGYGRQGRISSSLVSTKDAQFSVIKIDRPIGNPLFIRSTTTGGKTTTKVFSGDKLLKTYEGQAVPELVFTSARPIASARSRRSTYDFRQDIRKKYTTQNGVSNVFSKKYQAFGQSLGIEATKITTKTKSQGSTSTYQKFIDLDLQSGGLEFGGYNPIRTKYQYTKYPVSEKPFVKEFSAEGGIFVSKPTESLTTQRSFAKRVFQISYGKPVKNVPFVEKKQRPLVSKTLIELQTIYGKEKKARTPQVKGSQFSIGKQETVNFVKIQTAKVKNYLFKSDFKVFSPVKVATRPASRGVVLASVLGVKSRTRQRQNVKPIIDTTPMSRQSNINDVLLSPKVATKNILTQKNIQKQSIKQQQRSITKQLNIQLNLNANPIFNPRFNINTPRTPFTPKTPRTFLWDWQSKGSKKAKSILNTNTAFSGKYTASVGAVLFNIRGKRPSKSEYSSGLTVRPLPL